MSVYSCTVCKFRYDEWLGIRIDTCLRWWDSLDCNRQKNIRNRVTKRQQLHLTSNEFMQRRRARGEIAAHGGCRI